MFERYTEAARRTIFFARYEASQLHTGQIEPVHLLLGLFREDALLRELMSSAARESLREHIEKNFMGTETVTTSVDLPLSADCKRVLDVAKEEAEKLGSRPIDSAHLVLGLLAAAPELEKLLRPHGIDRHSYREALFTRAPRPKQEIPSVMVESRSHALEEIAESAAGQRLKRLPWTRKEALGHLIDWATAHHQWIARALVEKKVVAHGYPDGERVAAQKYAEMLWLDLVIAWLSMDDLLAQVILRIPPEKLETPCRIGIDAEVPLGRLIERYREYTKNLLAQICARGD
jgi:hypothetical protein